MEPSGTVCCFARANKQAAGRGVHCIECVGDEVRKDLSNFAIEAFDRALCPEARGELRLGVAEAALVDIEDLTDKRGSINLLRTARLTVEAESLRGDGRDTAKLALSSIEQGTDGLDVAGGADKEEEIRYCFEGIVNLVGNRGSETADGGKLLCLDEGFLRLLLLSDLL